MQRQAKEAFAERERARLIRDLHDGLLQNMTAAGLQIKLIADGANSKTRTRLDDVRQLLAGDQRRIREVMRKIRTPTERENDVALNTYLQNVLAEIARRWSCKTSLSVDPPEARAPTALCVHLSLMLGEAIANAVRHGQASTVRISIQKSPQDIAVYICDDGHGFDGCTSPKDKNLAPTSVGPLSLRDRIHELGGLLDVKSSPGGVELRIELPLTQ
jgi:signal transduction histidine kinase